MLNKHGRPTNQFGPPNVTHEHTEYDCLIAPFNMSEQAQFCRQMTPNLTSEQREIFDTVTTSALTNRGVYMTDVPAGTGKTYTECAIASNLRAQGKIVLCTSSIGSEAFMLPGGLTAHSTFELPFGD